MDVGSGLLLFFIGSIVTVVFFTYGLKRWNTKKRNNPLKKGLTTMMNPDNVTYVFDHLIKILTERHMGGHRFH